MNKFAKIFDMPGDHQVLITLRIDDEEIAIHQDTYYDGIYVRISIGFKDEREAEESFKKYNTDIATKFFHGVIDIIAV